MAAHRVLSDVANADVRTYDGVERFIKRTFTYTSGTMSIGFIPANARVTRVVVKATTAFNGSTATADVGDADDTDRLLDALQTDLTATTPTDHEPWHQYTSKTEVSIVITTTGTTTAGAGVVYVYFD